MSETEPRVKRALLIGIDAYTRFSALRGCVNDSQLMRKVLEENFGFPTENVTQLLNEQCTRDSILRAFDDLVDRVGPADIVVIHYAGHGAQMTDREGDEPSGYDSTIVPIDSDGWQGDNRDITDDEIHLRLLRLGEKTRYTTLVFDCCHSGTITRDSFGEAGRSAPADRRPISQLPPSPIPQEMWNTLRGGGPSGWMPLTGRYVLIAGCRDEEVSYEYSPPESGGKTTQGALTYFLCRELTNALPGATYRDVFENAAAQVTGNNTRQHPQMEGSADREIFGVRDVEPMRFVRVTERTGQTVALAAGAAHGMTPGSIWSIYPAGTRSAEQTESIGDVEITAVHAVTSTARVVSESTTAIAVNARAIEKVHAWGDLRMRVQLCAAPGFDEVEAELREALDKSPMLQRVGESESAAARVYLLAPRTSVGPADAVPQLGSLATATVAVVSDGEMVMPPMKLHEHGDVLANMQKLARYRQALTLANPDDASALRGKFELDLLHLKDGKWETAEPESESGHVAYQEGDRIAFRITSNHTRPVFVTLLDFGLSGSVSLMYPERGAQEALRPDGWFEVGTNEVYRLGFPKTFPFVADRRHDASVEAIETVKLIVTSSGADFVFLEQEGIHSGARQRGSSPLVRLWETATRGSATREIIKEPVGLEDWTTVVKPFVLRKKTGT